MVCTARYKHIDGYNTGKNQSDCTNSLKCFRMFSEVEKGLYIPLRLFFCIKHRCRMYMQLVVVSQRTITPARMKPGSVGKESCDYATTNHIWVALT